MAMFLWVAFLSSTVVHVLATECLMIGKVYEAVSSPWTWPVGLCTLAMVGQKVKLLNISAYQDKHAHPCRLCQNRCKRMWSRGKSVRCCATRLLHAVFLHSSPRVRSRMHAGWWRYPACTAHFLISTRRRCCCCCRCRPRFAMSKIVNRSKGFSTFCSQLGGWSLRYQWLQSLLGTETKVVATLPGTRSFLWR